MNKRGRILGVLLVMVLGFALVALRLVYLQVYERADLAVRAERQQQRMVKLDPKRGTIYDRMGRDLAVSLEVDSVFGVPAEIDDPRPLAARLSRILHEEPRSLEKKLRGDKQFVWLSRKVDPGEAEKIRELGSKAIGIRPETRRFYPKKSLAGPLLGFTDIDNQGLEGLERAYDKVLRGRSGWVLAEKDAVGRTVFPGGPGFQYQLPKAGHDIILTIDEVVQHIAEKELDAALMTARAKGGVCIVMNPQTGEVLGLAVRSGAHNRPAFNPNEPQRSKPAEWRNRAVTDAYEPGSIFKAVLAAAAIEERIVHPLERIDCSAGKIQLADRVINDSHQNGVLTFTDVIAESSNVGTIKVALRLGRERFARYIDAFGFGKKSGVDMPGEISGQLQDYRLWSGVSIGEIAIGQEIGVTPIQMAAAYSVLANGGTLMKPYIVSEIVDRSNGGEGKKFQPRPLGRVVSAETCVKVNRMLQRVIESGTGQHARLSGYTAAGKTGTAQKIDQRTGKYSKKEYVSSFVGFAPAGSPKVVVVVMVDTPEGDIYGGSVAAPVFKAVAEQVLAHLQATPDDRGGRMLLVTR